MNTTFFKKEDAVLTGSIERDGSHNLISNRVSREFCGRFVFGIGSDDNIRLVRIQGYTHDLQKQIWPFPAKKRKFVWPIGIEHCKPLIANCAKGDTQARIGIKVLGKGSPLNKHDVSPFLFLEHFSSCEFLFFSFNKDVSMRENLQITLRPPTKARRLSDDLMADLATWVAL
jgi:hypothetical protein